MPLGGGAQFAGYRVQRLLGVGGMGEVYLVQHPRLPRREALKVLRPDVSADAVFRERFSREAELVSNLWHPHIVGVHDRGEFHGQLWLSMDYIDGLDASRLARERYPAGMPHREVVGIVSAVADALDYAHHRGLMHRDVKPANIMVSLVDNGPAGETSRVMLTDFGIARPVGEMSWLTDAGRSNLTVGTVSYSAPEQLMGQHIDGRADQYSLAATAYRLVTGAHLFDQTNPVAVIGAHLNSPPPMPSSVRPELAPLDRVFARALAKNPADRFGSCAQFAEAFDREFVSAAPDGRSEGGVTLPAPVTWRPPRPAPEPPPAVAAYGAAPQPFPQPTPVKPPHKRRSVQVLAAAVAVLLVAAIGTFAATRPSGPSAAEVAAQNRDAARQVGQQYLQALADGDADAALAVTAQPPRVKEFLTDDVLRDQLADLEITGIDVTAAEGESPEGARPDGSVPLTLKATFGDTESEVDVLAREKDGQWKLDTGTIKLPIGPRGSNSSAFKAVALSGIPVGKAGSVYVFPGLPRVSSANPSVDVTAPTEPLLLDQLAAGAKPPPIEPVVTLNEAGRNASFAALEAWHRHCVAGGPKPPECCPPDGCKRLPPPPGTTDAGVLTDTQRILRLDRSENMTYELNPDEMVVRATGTMIYWTEADTTNAGRKEMFLYVTVDNRIDITANPAAVIPKNRP